MKWAIFLFAVSCVVDRNEHGTTKFDTGSNTASSDGGSSYYRYKFSRGGNSIDISFKVDRSEGKLTTLHTIDTRTTDEPVNSVPLEANHNVAGRARTPTHTGFSYVGQGGIYSIYDDTNGPPEINFRTFSGDGWQGEFVTEQRANEWQRQADRRPKQNFTEPKPLDRRQENWFKDNFHEVFGTEKFDQNRAIDFPQHGRSYYGAVYKLWNSAGECWTHIWGLDDPEVVEFLYNLRNKLTFRKVETSRGDQNQIWCARDSDDLVLGCDDNKYGQEAFQVVDGRLLITNRTDGSTVYIDNMGRCGAM